MAHVHQRAESAPVHLAAAAACWGGSALSAGAGVRARDGPLRSAVPKALADTSSWLRLWD